MRKTLLALGLMIMLASGCRAPQIVKRDVDWPSDKKLADMRVPTTLPEGWENTPFLPPINDPLLAPFGDNGDVFICGYNKSGVPLFAHKENKSREDLVWGLTHINNNTRREEIDEMQVYSFPAGTIDRLKRGEIPASEFSIAIFQKTDGVWHRLDFEEIDHRHKRWHFPRLASIPVLKYLATTDPTYEQASCYPQNLALPNGRRPINQPTSLAYSTAQ